MTVPSSGLYYAQGEIGSLSTCAGTKPVLEWEKNCLAVQLQDLRQGLYHFYL